MLSKFLVATAALIAAAHGVSITVSSNGGNASSAYQYGLMFEDINQSGDGGVYAELVQNRAFQGNDIFPSNLGSWYPIGAKTELALKSLSTPLSSALPNSMRLTTTSKTGTIGFWNEGYWGFPIVSGWKYTGSFYMQGAFDGKITVALQSNTTSKTYAQSVVTVASTLKKGWTQYNYTFSPTANAPDSDNTLRFTLPASAVKGPLDFNLLSLFPPTYNDRPNGLRVDLMEAMKSLNPSFFRAPGGNNLEGLASPYWWNWTRTIGPLTDRPGFPGTWGYENTDGLGLIEYILWAKDIGMEPLLAVWSGLWLDGTVVPKNELGVYVQSALDELEFLMGDKSTTWGARRVALGYPEPFDIKFVEVGNEDSLNGGKDTYGEYRFDMFYDAIHKAYPNITIIASYYDVGPVHPPYGCAGDFHEYVEPHDMVAQFTYFDNYSSSNPLLLGEYAVVEYDNPAYPEVTFGPGELRSFFPFWYGSIAEAIYLLGAERNSDKVIGASYAPGFMNTNNWQWVPDSIQFDANPAHTVLSTSYQMIKLLSGTRMTQTLPTKSGAGFGPAYYVAGRNADTGSHVFKTAVYNSTKTLPFKVTFDGVAKGAAANLTYITAPMNASSTIGHDVVTWHSQTVTAAKGGLFSFSLPDWSVAVLEVDAATAGYAEKLSRQDWLAANYWEKR